MLNSHISLTIPINFSQRQEIATALECQYGAEYVLIGRIFQSTISNESCQIEMCDRQSWLESHHDLSLVEDFKFAGQDNFDLATLEKIDSCPLIIGLTSNNTGYDACLQIARLAQVILKIGGVAIKVESAGIAHYRYQWLTNYNSADVFEIYNLFVMLLEGEDYYYSCGMHNFGKADVAIDLQEDLGLAIYVMNVLNYYRLTESPILLDGHTFQPDIECPPYQIKLIADQESTIDNPQYNPDGRWYLSRST